MADSKKHSILECDEDCCRIADAGTPSKLRSILLKHKIRLDSKKPLIHSPQQKAVRFSTTVEARRYDQSDIITRPIKTADATRIDNGSTQVTENTIHRRQYPDLPTEIRCKILVYCLLEDSRLQLGRRGWGGWYLNETGLPLDVAFPKIVRELMGVSKQMYEDVPKAFTSYTGRSEVELQSEERSLVCPAKGSYVHHDPLACKVSILRTRELPRFGTTHQLRSNVYDNYAMSYLNFMLPNLRKVIIEKPYNASRKAPMFIIRFGNRTIDDFVAGRADDLLATLGTNVFKKDLAVQTMAYSLGGLIWEFKVSIPYIWLIQNPSGTLETARRIVEFAHKDLEYTCRVHDFEGICEVTGKTFHQRNVD